MPGGIKESGGYTRVKPPQRSTACGHLPLHGALQPLLALCFGFLAHKLISSGRSQSIKQPESLLLTQGRTLCRSSTGWWSGQWWVVGCAGSACCPECGWAGPGCSRELRWPPADTWSSARWISPRASNAPGLPPQTEGCTAGKKNREIRTLLLQNFNFWWVWSMFAWRHGNEGVNRASWCLTWSMPLPLHCRMMTSNSLAAWHSASSPASMVSTYNRSKVTTVDQPTQQQQQQQQQGKQDQHV